MCHTSTQQIKKKAIMNIENLSNDAICVEMGERIKSLRLRKNLTQEDVARLTHLSLNPIKSLEQGQAKLSTIVAVMRVLGSLGALDSFISEAPVSPLQIAKMHGKKRQRGSGRRVAQASQEQSKW
jgi:transcriptional regulator with XRE-family HTH domain